MTVEAPFPHPGPDPTVVVQRDQVASFPVHPVSSIVDTTGAGDAFAGAFMAAAVDGAGVGECVRCGHKAAAHVLGREGAAPHPDFH